MTPVELVGRLSVGPAPLAQEACLAVRSPGDDTLGQHGAEPLVPAFDRSALTPAVVHVSVGGVHRAHQLLCFDDVAEGRISSVEVALPFSPRGAGGELLPRGAAR